MAGEDKEYTDWLRMEPCCAPGCGATPVQVHHLTGAGISLRNHDHHGMPLCKEHHDALHQVCGPFRQWSLKERQSWQRTQILIHRLRYEKGWGTMGAGPPF